MSFFILKNSDTIFIYVFSVSAPWTFDLGAAMQKLVQQGLHLHIVWEEFGQCAVPSSNDSDLHYNVNTVELLCSCHHPPGYGKYS